MSSAYWYLLLVLAACLLVFMTKFFLISESLYFNTFAEQLTYDQIERMISESQKWEWLGYVLSPILLSLKITLIAACLSIGVFFVSNRFSYKQLFAVVLRAEFVFFVPPLLSMVWFTFFQTDYTLTDL